MDNGIEHQERLFRGIGELVINFQKLENNLSEALTQLLGLQVLTEDQDIMEAALSFGQKVDLFSALHRRGKDDDANYLSLCKLSCDFFKSAEQFRNAIIHSHYSVVTAGKGLRWVQSKKNIRGGKGLRNRKKMVNFSALEAGSKAINDACYSAIDFSHYAKLDEKHEELIKGSITCLRDSPIYEK